MTKALSEYNRKRNFKITSEPSGDTKASGNRRAAHALQFVIQKHDARRLHYDFRLEMSGTLKSWAVPKGPSLDPKDKRLAVHVEDHPVSYASFEGSIPEGQYGGGDVIVWDQGIWQPHDDPDESYAAGKIKFTLIGEKLTGDWTLVKTKLRGNSDKEQWLLIKEQDEVARSSSEYDITKVLPQSVVTGDLLKSEQKVNTTSARTSDEQSSSEPSSKKISIKTLPKKIAATAETPAKETPSKKSSAKKIILPDTLIPELATLVSEPPSGDWLYEIKFDGYRIVARIKNGEVRLFTRNGNDWTDRLPLQAKAIAELKLKDSWLDGEVVVLNDEGLPDFQALQNAFDIGRSHNIVYYLFDAPYLNGIDQRDQPVEIRRAALEKIIAPLKKSPLRFSAAFMQGHEDILASACSMSLEGIMGKRAGSPYVTRRSGDWIKLKCRLRQEFVIVGYTKPQGSRSGFGALLVAVHEKIGSADLRYGGRVGTGFNDEKLKNIFQQMKELERDSSPLAHKVTSAQKRDVIWVEPKLICEVEFAQWTGEDVLRQAAFIALRTDKPVRDIIREQALPPSKLKAAEAENQRSEIKSEADKNIGDESAGNKSTGSKSKVKETEGKEMASTKLERAKSVSEEVPTKERASEKASPKKSLPKKVSTEEIDTKPAQKKKTTTLAKKDQDLKITITHPDRVIDPESSGTKKDLAMFYAEISDWILPHLNDRPVSILRAPEGITGELFFQKHTEHLAIPNIKHLDKSLDPGHAPLMEIDTTQALVGAVQMGTIELHTWGAKSTAIEMPDRITLDLDPDPALPWRSVIEATRLTLAVLEELKLQAFLKTTGGKGMHIVIPLAPKAEWEHVKEFSKAIAQFMARQIPERFVAKMGPKNRIGKIFIDYLRNQRGASTVSAYSVRSRPGLPVSVPIKLDELEKLKSSSQWTIQNLHERLDDLKKDPWDDYTNHQVITQTMWKKLDANHR